MPEVEAYRALAVSALDREIAAVDGSDLWYLKAGLDEATATTALVGRHFVAARRIGKLLLLDSSGDGPVLGLRFGMTGRLLVDGRAGVERLLRSGPGDRPEWDRFAVRFGDGGSLVMRDPRRLGGVILDPVEAALGTDARDVTAAGLRTALASSAPLKARLLDQSRLAGIGNLLADEVLWRAGLDPRRPAGGLTAPEVRRLHRHLAVTLGTLIERGGSHTGDLMAARRPGGTCPRDGAPLERTTVGGRTTWWCPTHQR
ncbi:MAG: DNA-formamidopyrimidine glycosylase family protein [Acidimicrobiales bacterium]